LDGRGQAYLLHTHLRDGVTGLLDVFDERELRGWWQNRDHV
jgi:hypothetical protein